MDLDVLPNAQCTQFHGKWAEKDRNFGVTLMIEPVFMRATREGVKIIVVVIAVVVVFRERIMDLVSNTFDDADKVKDTSFLEIGNLKTLL